MTFFHRLLLSAVFFSLVPLPGGASSAPAPRMAEAYLDLMVTYATYAKSIWHDAEVGGYWGDGVGAKNENGAVRGMANSMLGYATLARADREGWLTPGQRRRLSDAGLDRKELLHYVHQNMRHMIAHHKSAPSPQQPVWGDHWQSPLWLSAAGFAALINYEDVPGDLLEGLRRMTRHEADRVASIPPHDAKPGNTAAEENAWDALAPALALALEPGHSSAETWFKALNSYAVNTYSTPADRLSSATVGNDLVSSIVTTANILDDFTLENHGFFHPDYVQVSGQHLGEAWLLLTLGDQIHSTTMADRFKPYSMHHVADVWNEVMRWLIHPSGELLFPSGNDWTFHCSMNQSYLAFIATALQDPVAQLAEERAIRAAQRRREVSPPGRILGDSNLEWWWEPLLVKRLSTALLHHLVSPTPNVTDAAREQLDQGSWTKRWDGASIWLHRNPHYTITLSWGKQRMGCFVPSTGSEQGGLYGVIPIEDGVVPNQIAGLAQSTTDSATLRLNDGQLLTVLALPTSALWISPVQLRSLAIENDPVVGAGRELHWADGNSSFPALVAREPVQVQGNWVNLDGRFGHVISTGGFTYTPAGGYNRKSVAVDRLAPKAGAPVVWQMITGADVRRTAELAESFKVTAADGQVRVLTGDGHGTEHAIATGSRP